MQVSTSLGTTDKNDTGDTPVLPSGSGRTLFWLVAGVFFLWGMSNNLTDILVQQFRKSFELSLTQAQLVSTANFLAYGVMAIPAALLTRRFGYKGGILIGLCLFGLGTLLFWPAAVVGQYSFFLVALFACGGGASILETACNPFMAQFGDPSTSERRLNLAQAFNPPGTILGVWVGATFIFSGIEKNAGEVSSMKAAGTYAGYLHGEIMRVVPTYVVLSAVILLLAFLISRMKFPTGLDAGEGEDQGSFAALLRYPNLMLAVVAQFAYVGAQVGTWANFIPYMKEYTPMSEKAAGYLFIGNLVALMIGRIVSTPLMKYLAPAKMAGIYAVINVALLLVPILHPGYAGGYVMIATSFFMSIMFPTIFALGVKGLGPNTKLGGSLIVMAILGGALFPLLMGMIRDRTGSLAAGYWLPLAGYVVVALYGFLGDREGTGVHEVNMSPEAL